MTFIDLAGAHWDVPEEAWEHAISADATHASITAASTPAGPH